MPHEAITEAILGAAFEVSNELGNGFLEAVYERALELVLRERGFQVARQQPIKVLFRGTEVGTYQADLLVNGLVLVELKAVKSLLPEHQAQVIHYLKATGLCVGLLINFGTAKIEYKRLTWNNTTK